jgi:hypothetical protein
MATKNPFAEHAKQEAKRAASVAYQKGARVNNTKRVTKQIDGLINGENNVIQRSPEQSK